MDLVNIIFFGRFQTLAQFGSFLGAYDELVLGRIILVILLALGVLGLIPAYLASRKGRNFLDWWIFGTLLFPVALVMAWFLKPIPVAPSPEEPV